MGSVSQAVQNPARRALSHGALNTMEGAADDRPLSTRVLTGADSPSSGMLHLTAHFCGLMPMEGPGMGRRSIGRPLGTSNIVPGMPGDHPASIPEARGRPGAPRRPSNRNTFFYRKFSPEQDQLQNPAHVPVSLP